MLSHLDAITRGLSSGPEDDHGIVPVLRPQLPSAERLLPYLRAIDESRMYSNWGPLARELEMRLAGHLRLPAEGVASASSGTAALAGAILAVAGRADEDRSFAIVPSFTFVGTATAVEQCGYRPYLADIDAGSWMLEPEHVARHPALDRIGVVVPVAPFGRPTPQLRWREFRDATGIPVVIDGAASFDCVAEASDVHLGDIPVAMSFNATKSFGTGEGGCVASTDTDLIVSVAQALNFGFNMTRESRGPSINGRMSEYHAAVGLAELDEWPQKSLSVRAVVEDYRREAAHAGLGDRLIAPPDVSGSYVLFQCHDEAEARRVEGSLVRHGVDHRLWYGTGLHHHEYFAGLPRDHLAVTEHLAPLLLGVPMAPDLTAGVIARIVSALAEGVRAS